MNAKGAIMKNLPRSAARGAERRCRARQAGMTMVEFAIVSPIALLVVLALIQLGLMFTAKQIVNEATFVAARAGSVQNAQVSAMQQALIVALIPFYQDSLDADPGIRIRNAAQLAKNDLTAQNLTIDLLNPSADVFSDFGLTDANNDTYIPNDSLEYRDYSVRGQKTGLTIQDANALKIRVTYAYQLKVPLMQSVFRSVMCGFNTGVNAFGRGGSSADASNCAQYYNRGRVPIVSYATVQMQTCAVEQATDAGSSCSSAKPN
jgi:Flp pilus assembly protein TadG